LINERYQIDELFSGKNLERYPQYRVCYLLAKHYRDIGLQPIDVRKEIFTWAKTHNYWINENLNSIIQKVFSDKIPVIEDVKIRISEQDVSEIRRRFDSKNSRITALAILCCAKCFADKHGYMKVSLRDIACWVGIAAQNISSRTMKELIAFGYVSELDKYQKKRAKYNGGYFYKPKSFKINVSFKNEGDVVFDGGDILTLYHKLFD